MQSEVFDLLTYSEYDRYWKLRYLERRTELEQLSTSQLALIGLGVVPDSFQQEGRRVSKNKKKKAAELLTQRLQSQRMGSPSVELSQVVEVVPVVDSLLSPVVPFPKMATVWSMESGKQIEFSPMKEDSGKARKMVTQYLDWVVPSQVIAWSQLLPSTQELTRRLLAGPTPFVQIGITSKTCCHIGCSCKLFFSKSKLFGDMVYDLSTGYVGIQSLSHKMEMEWVWNGTLQRRTMRSYRWHYDLETSESVPLFSILSKGVELEIPHIVERYSITVRLNLPMGILNENLRLERQFFSVGENCPGCVNKIHDNKFRLAEWKEGRPDFSRSGVRKVDREDYEFFFYMDPKEVLCRGPLCGQELLKGQAVQRVATYLTLFLDDMVVASMQVPVTKNPLRGLNPPIMTQHMDWSCLSEQDWVLWQNYASRAIRVVEDGGMTRNQIFDCMDPFQVEPETPLYPQLVQRVELSRLLSCVDPQGKLGQYSNSDRNRDLVYRANLIAGSVQKWSVYLGRSFDVTSFQMFLSWLRTDSLILFLQQVGEALIPPHVLEVRGLRGTVSAARARARVLVFCYGLRIGSPLYHAQVKIRGIIQSPGAMIETNCQIDD
jgi:hypothetical protein